MIIQIWIAILSMISTNNWHGDHHHAFSISETFIVEASTKDVQDLFINLEAFGQAHPLITDVSCLNTNSYCYQYAITEKPFSWLPFIINYEAEILNPDYRKKVVYTITKIPWMQPTINYQFQVLENGSTSIEVNILIEGSWLWRRTLGMKMMKAQRVVIQNAFRS